jgi:hypothetical protein
MLTRHRISPVFIASLLLVCGAHAQDFRDPMRPPGSAPAVRRPARIATIKLEGVISGPVRVAIINGRLVRAGDEVAGARIVEVLAGGVRYSRAGQIHILSMPGVQALGSRVAQSSEANKP